MVALNKIPDRDGLSNLEEYQLGTRPDYFDSDGDLLPDGWEHQHGLNLLNHTPLDSDSDGDGLDLFDEYLYGTDPNNNDSDGDGTNDQDEVDQGSFPNDSSDGGQSPDPNEMLTVKIIVGDPSGSHSERWSVEVTDLKTDSVILNHQSPAFGELSSDADSTYNQFRRDRSYELKLVHLGTDPAKDDPDFYPDYDWALEVSVQDADGNFVDVTDDTATKPHFVVLDPWDPTTDKLSDTIKLLVNRDNLQYPWEGQPDRNQQYQNQIASKRVRLLKVDLGYLVDEQEPAVGAEYNLFDGPQRYLKGRRINFELDGAEDIPSAQIDWDGTFGVTSIGGGHRTWKVYLDPASSSETDYKTVIAEIASSIVAEEEILVCKYVLGIHSNAGPDSGFTAGHAWITLADWTNGTNPTVTRLGLWPDEHQRTIDNGDESDVRENLEKSVLGAYNRFYLLSPSEFQNLINFRNQHAEWTYFNTCANWAMDAVQAAVGEEVDASDTVFFGTPRKISESIISLEAEEPTTGLEPRDSGADIEEGSSTGNSTWTGTSFSN